MTLLTLFLYTFYTGLFFLFFHPGNFLFYFNSFSFVWGCILFVSLGGLENPDAGIPAKTRDGQKKKIFLFDSR